MRFKYFMSCFASTLLFGFILIVIYNIVALNNFKKESQLLVSDTILSNYFIYNELHHKGNEINISFTPTDKFESLSNEDQFVYLSQFHRLLRFHLKNGSTMNSYYAKDIRFNLLVNNIPYTYYDVHDERLSLYLHKGILEIGESKIHENTVRNSTTFIKNHIEPNILNKTNGYYDTEIIEYMQRFGNIITKYGRDINRTPDEFIIATETMKKYNLNMEEMNEIFFRWYFFIFDNPFSSQPSTI